MIRNENVSGFQQQHWRQRGNEMMPSNCWMTPNPDIYTHTENIILSLKSHENRSEPKKKAWDRGNGRTCTGEAQRSHERVTWRPCMRHRRWLLRSERTQRDRRVQASLRFLLPPNHLSNRGTERLGDPGLGHLLVLSLSWMSTLMKFLLSLD